MRHQVLQVVLKAVLFNAAQLNHGQRDERQRRGDGDVAGGRGAVGNEPKRLQNRMKKNVSAGKAGNADRPRLYSAR